MLSSLLSVGLFAFGLATSNFSTEKNSVHNYDVNNFFNDIGYNVSANSLNNQFSGNQELYRISGIDLDNNATFTNFKLGHSNSLTAPLEYAPQGADFIVIENFNPYVDLRTESEGVYTYNLVSYSIFYFINTSYFYNMNAEIDIFAFAPRFYLSNLTKYSGGTPNNFNIVTDINFFNGNDSVVQYESVSNNQWELTLQSFEALNQNDNVPYIKTLSVVEDKTSFICGLTFGSGGNDNLPNYHYRDVSQLHFLNYCEFDSLFGLNQVTQDFYYNQGYEEGFRLGDDSGYERGLIDGRSAPVYDFWSLFAAIGDTPIVMVKNLFGFDLFGVSALAVVLSIFTALVLFYIIRKLMK